MLVILAPFIFIETIIVTKSVDMPYQDGWTLVPVFENLDAHHYVTATKLLWYQHNEHRPFFPNLFSVIVGEFTRWNIKVEMLLNGVLALATFSIFIWYAKKSARKKAALYIFLPIMALMLFSPNQWENWLWGWQIEWLFCVLAGVLALALLDRKFQKASINLKLIAAALLCFIATFSVGNGFVFWLVGYIPLFANKYSRKKILLWTLGFVFSLALYFYHYEFLAPGPLKVHFIDYIQFIFAYIGSSFSQDLATAVTVGVVITVVSVLLVYKARVIDKMPDDKIAFPLGIMIFVLASDIITLHSRLSIFGPDGALASRYVIVSTLYTVAILLLLMQILADKFSLYLTAAILLPFVIGGYINNMTVLNQHAKYYASVKQCLVLPNPVHVCKQDAYPDVTNVTNWLEFVKAKHLAGF